MRYRWVMSLVAMVVLAQSPEERLARKLDHEAQFQLRFARRDAALQKLQIAEWLSPNINRQTFLKLNIKTSGRGERVEP